MELTGLKVGDKALITGGFGRESLRVTTVKKIGKVAITTESDSRWNIRTGRLVGSDRWSATFLVPFDQARWDRFQEAVRVQELRQKVRDTNWSQVAAEKLEQIIAILGE